MKDRPVRNGRVMPVEAIDFQGKSAIFLPQEARYANGICLPEDHPCNVINPACKTIHDGAVDCDYFLSAVLPLQPELNTGVWHEILREEDQTGEGWKACVRCHKPFIPGSNRQRYCAECGAVAKKAANREKQRRHWERQKTVV